jgi:hypothetical protein
VSEEEEKKGYQMIIFFTMQHPRGCELVGCFGTSGKSPRSLFGL